jgi:hypothetical protein
MITRFIDALLWSSSVAMFIGMLYSPVLWRWINGG